MTMNRPIPAEPAQADDLFVTFANTLSFTRGRPTDALPDTDALLRWLHAKGLISDRARASEAGRLRRDADEAERRLARFRHLRTVLHEIAGEVDESGRVSPERLRDLNHILRHGLHYHQLHMETGATRYAFAQVGDRLDQARATIAASLARFLAGEDPQRLRVCGNPGCRELFIDRSPTGRRRWCEMRTCGNRAKAARHRARAKVPPTSVAAD